MSAPNPLYAEIDRLQQEVLVARALSDEHRSAMQCALGESIRLREELLQCRSSLALAAESAAGDAELIAELVAILREWKATEFEQEDEEMEPWMDDFTARVDAVLLKTEGTA